MRAWGGDDPEADDGALGGGALSICNLFGASGARARAEGDGAGGAGPAQGGQECARRALRSVVFGGCDRGASQAVYLMGDDVFVAPGVLNGALSVLTGDNDSVASQRLCDECGRYLKMLP